MEQLQSTTDCRCEQTENFGLQRFESVARAREPTLMMSPQKCLISVNTD